MTRSGQKLAAGFALYLLAVLVALAIGASLSACAGLQPAIDAYGAVAVSSARAANDTIIEAQKVSFCGLPYSAIQRHSEIAPAVETLCGPLPAPAAK